jgi:hypothetical protein
MQWISVKDRLPEIGKDVLTYDGEDVLVEYLIDLGDALTWSCSHFMDISHWMLLPPVPAITQESRNEK